MIYSEARKAFTAAAGKIGYGKSFKEDKFLVLVAFHSIELVVKGLYTLFLLFSLRILLLNERKTMVSIRKDLARSSYSSLSAVSF